jgi:hypothetical protein
MEKTVLEGKSPFCALPFDFCSRVPKMWLKRSISGCKSGCGSSVFYHPEGFSVREREILNRQISHERNWDGDSGRAANLISLTSIGGFYAPIDSEA